MVSLVTFIQQYNTNPQRLINSKRLVISRHGTFALLVAISPQASTLLDVDIYKIS